MFTFGSYIVRKIRFAISKLREELRFQRQTGVTPSFDCTILGAHNVTAGKNFTFGRRCEFYAQDSLKYPAGKIQIGDNVALNSGVILNADCGGQIKIGNNVLVGPNVILRASNHNTESVDQAIRYQGHTPGQIVIEDDVWIGAGTLMLPNVTIGRGSVIGAGSVVTKDVAPYSVVAGNPAKFIRNVLDNPKDKYTQ